MGKDPSPVPPSGPVVERDDVRVATNRCPFCHDDIVVDQDSWVSCRSCQARHHDQCWTEQGQCSACGHDRHLTEATPATTEMAPAPTPPPTRLSGDPGRWGLRVSLAAVSLGALGTLLSYQSEAPALDIPFGPRFEMGEPGLNLLGMVLVALITVPMALIGAGLGVAGLRREPEGVGQIALAVNAVYVLGLIALVVASA